jgi:PKD repeat protein
LRLAKLTLILFFLAAIAPPPATASTRYRLTYTIDRAAVPDLYYRQLTLNAYVGSVTLLEITADGEHLPHHYEAATGVVTFTTDAGSIQLLLEEPSDLANVGSFTRAPLKDNKKWAWSHGMDDNVLLQPSIEVLSARGWRGTLFLIGKDIADERDEPWVIDAPAVRRLVAAGWSFGNHTWDHACGPPSLLEDPGFMNATVTGGYNRLASIIQSSSVPDYRLITFAAPCFRAEYHPYIVEMVANGHTGVQFNESGNDYRLIVNAGAPDYTQDGKTAVSFNYHRPIGRDFYMEMGSAGVAKVKGEMDWMAANAAVDRHFWYNTLTHGSWEDALNQVVAYVYEHYGPGGSNEVWVAPSDEIYSYLLLRDRSHVSFTVEEVTPEPPVEPPVEPPAAAFSAQPGSGVAPLLVHFSNESAGEYDQVLWDFGDGHSSQEFSPSHTYEAPGIYSITLSLSGPGGSNSHTKPAYIDVDPEPGQLFTLFLPLVVTLTEEVES